jgi:DNA-directed RNA polymerase specialized sigma24 family protein
MVLKEEPLEELIDLNSVSRIEARLMLRRVKIALMGIPAEQRRALMLQCNGASTKEIADILCCSEDAAKHRVYRARKSLKEKL